MNGHWKSVVWAFLMAAALGSVAEASEFGPGRAGRRIGYRRARYRSRGRKAKKAPAKKKAKKKAKKLRLPGRFGLMRSNGWTTGDAAGTDGMSAVRPVRRHASRMCEKPMTRYGVMSRPPCGPDAGGAAVIPRPAEGLGASPFSDAGAQWEDFAH